MTQTVASRSQVVVRTQTDLIELKMYKNVTVEPQTWEAPSYDFGEFGLVVPVATLEQVLAHYPEKTRLLETHPLQRGGTIRRPRSEGANSEDDEIERPQTKKPKLGNDSYSEMEEDYNDLEPPPPNQASTWKSS